MSEFWSCQGHNSGLKTTAKVPLKLMFFCIKYLVYFQLHITSPTSDILSAVL